MAAPPPRRPASGGPRPAPRPGAGRYVPAPMPVRPTRGVRRAALAAPGSAVAPEPALAAQAPLGSGAGYLPALDGLRAVSVLAVLAYHLEKLHGGFLGVDVFFVISGFLITRLLLAEVERDGGVSLGAFWVRRFRRLLPVLLVVIVLVMVGSRLWLPAFRLGAIRFDALAALFYVANWRFILSGQSYFGSNLAPSPLRHTWSLAIEEQYYVVWPLVVAGLGRIRRWPLRRLVAVVAGASTLASAIWMAVAAATGADLSRIYYGTDTRAFALFAGAWLGAWWDPSRANGTRAARRMRARRWSLVGGLALLPLAALLLLGTTREEAFYQGGFQLAAVLSVLAVAGLATGDGLPARVLGTRGPVWLGRRSYGIYLWSWPVQVFVSEQLRLESWALVGVVVPITFALATLSFWLVEEPLRTGSRPAGLGRRRSPEAPRSSRSARPLRPAPAALSILAVVAVIVGVSAGAPAAPDYTRVSDEEALAEIVGPITDADRAMMATTTTTQVDPAAPPGPLGAETPALVDPTASADPLAHTGQPLRIMIAGDSVGWSLGWKLGPDLTDSVRLFDRALIGCGLMPPESSFIVGDREPEQYGPTCQQADLAEFKGLGDKPDAVLLWVGAWEVYDHEVDGRTYPVGSRRFERMLEERMQLRIDRYKGVGAITVMPVVPCFAENAARLGEERHDQDRLDWVNERIRAVAERNPGWVRLIDPADQLCTPDGEARPETPTGVPLREDGSHFDPPAAVWFWNTWLAGQMAAAFDVEPPAEAPNP